MFNSGKEFLMVSISLIPFDENALNEPEMQEKRPEHDFSELSTSTEVSHLFDQKFTNENENISSDEQSDLDFEIPVTKKLDNSATYAYVKK